MCYNFATFVLYLDVITLIYRENRLTSSETPLSAIKGVNQAFARFTPFFTPKNVKLGVFVFLRFFKRMSITKRLVFLWTGRMNLYDEKYSYSKK